MFDSAIDQQERIEQRYLATIVEEADFDDVLSTRNTLPLTAIQTELHLQPQQLQRQQHQQNGTSRQFEASQYCSNDVCEQKAEMWLTPMSDHFPTPRGLYFLPGSLLPSSSSSTSTGHDDDINEQSSHDNNPIWKRPASIMSDVTEFDGIYDCSDDEFTTQTRKLKESGTGRYYDASRRTSLAISRLGDSSLEHVHELGPHINVARRPTTLLAGPDHKLSTSAVTSTPSAQVPMSPAVISFMQTHHALDVPAESTPPSLDGSLTSEQLSHISAQISAPPTPVVGVVDDENANDASWTGVQLQPDAFAILQSLARSDTSSVADMSLEPEYIIEIPVEVEQPGPEMSENRSLPRLTLATSGLPCNTIPFSPIRQRSLNGLTRLEIPSPGGFFLGLSPRTRETWHMPDMTLANSAHPPTTTTAERFYKLPWADGDVFPVPCLEERPLHLPGANLPDLPVERFIDAPLADFEDPVTAFRAQMSPLTAQLVVPDKISTAGVETDDRLAELAVPAEPNDLIEKVDAGDNFNESMVMDAQQLQKIAMGQLDRTEKWLHAQRAYLVGIAGLPEAIDETSYFAAADAETTLEVPLKDESELVSSSNVAHKETVHLLGTALSSAVPCTLPTKMLHKESAYYRAFTESIIRTSFTDSFINRLPRFETLQTQRLLLRKAHRHQLLGKYQLTVVPQSAKKRMSANVVRGDDSLLDDPAGIRAEKELEALNQMALTTWHVAAQRLLDGGRLVSAPVHRLLMCASRIISGPNSVRRDRTRVLDLGSQATCDWAWHVALQYPNTKVYSVTTKVIRQLSNANIRGPSNHRQVAVEKLTHLPFEDNQFDLVRATELYSILKSVGEVGEDEWDSCLHECYRVLKPGGYIDFTVLDSDIINAGPLGNAKSVEFGFVLQTLGYDPSPTKMFLGRLSRARFVDVKRMWMCLPVGPRPESLTKPTAARNSIGAAAPTVQLDNMVQGSTDNIAAVTGLVGSLSWERWLLRAEMEKIAGEWRLADSVIAGAAIHEAGKSIDGVHAIVEEGRTTGAAWRMLRGHARKPRFKVETIDNALYVGS
ncbi:hypothetical protein SEPCBS57363_000791 [Sporothrix epigloea]|uniref:Methyltransferase type 11 domain-containing protein n=1 Tax=Sporothrix epigloea TaxID=1892477 RepID=A0ABP0D6Z0_9PEZI